MAARKRMFLIDIINAGEFLDLSHAAQALYFQIAMRADDDGFLKVSKRLLAYIGESDTDLHELTKAGFLLEFDGGVYVVRHWQRHNKIKQNQKQPTEYKHELAQLENDNGVYMWRTSDGQAETIKPPYENHMTTPKKSYDEHMKSICGEYGGEYGGKKSPQNRLEENSIVKIRTVDPQNDTTTTPNTPPEAAHDEPYNPENDPNTIKGKIKAIREEREKQKKFTPPTLEMVKAYCEERGNGIDPAQFLDYYTANGWTQGKGKPIKDWQACVRTWERNGYHGTGGTYNGTNGTPDGEIYTNYYPQYAGNDLDKLPPITSTDGEKLPFQ